MAIKGKKKSQSRGSQARRRPAMAPRPVGRTQKPPWYKTTAGQAIAGITVLIAIVVGLALVNNARSAAQEKELAQETLENYTDQVRALLQRVTAPASELAAVPSAAPEDLADKAKEWSDNFAAAQTEVAQFIAPDEASASRDLFLQSLQLYKNAADTMGVAAGLEGEDQTELIATATTQVTSASAIWDSAVAVLDDARDEAEIAPSGIRSPTAAPPSGAQTPPAPSVTVPVEPGDNGGDGGGKGGKGGKGDGADG